MNGELFGMSNDNKDIVTSVFSATSIDDYNNTNVSNGYKLTKVLKEAAEDEFIITDSSRAWKKNQSP